MIGKRVIQSALRHFLEQIFNGLFGARLPCQRWYLLAQRDQRLLMVRSCHHGDAMTYQIGQFVRRRLILIEGDLFMHGLISGAVKQAAVFLVQSEAGSRKMRLMTVQHGFYFVCRGKHYLEGDMKIIGKLLGQLFGKLFI